MPMIMKTRNSHIALEIGRWNKHYCVAWVKRASYEAVKAFLDK